MEQNNKQTMPCFELGNLYVFKEEDEDGELTIIGKLIGKNESEDTLTFGNQYEIENEKFVTDQAFDLRISTNKELREATEDEAKKRANGKGYYQRYYLLHKEKLLEKSKSWLQNHPEKVKEYQRRYYQKKRAAAKKEKKIMLNPDIDKAKALFRDPTKAAHLQWILEHNRNKFNQYESR